MNNRDWLYTMQPRDLARWFDAEHVEPNDDLPPEKGVSGMDGGSNDACMAQDSREKLLYDASELVADCAPSGGDCDPMYREIIELLDRQAAITERECLERATGELVGWDCAECAEGLGRELDARCDLLKERIAEMQAKVDGLTAERDQLTNAINELQKKQPYCYNPEQPLGTLNTIGRYIDELTAERDEWRERCGRMLDAAHELARIAEVDE